MKRFSLRLWPRSNEQSLLGAGGRADDEAAVVDAVVKDEEKRFGIKSYLHHFYSPTVEDLDNSNAWYLLPPPPAQRMSVYVCRVVTMIGLLLLLAGAGLIIVGYTWQPTVDIEDRLTRISVSQDEDNNFYILPERLSEILFDPMSDWKIAGFCVFATGAALMAISLLLPTCAHVFGGNKRLPFVSEDNTPNEPPVRIYPAMTTVNRFRVSPSKLSSPQRISPSGPVPVMEEIAKVQPHQNKSAGSSANELMTGEADALLR